MLLLVVFAVTPALILPQYKLPPRRPASTRSPPSNDTYTDKSRIETFTNTGENRKVNVEFWYPKDAGEKMPLVVFSHGAFGMKTSNTSTFMELASNGYVVCSIDHPYHSLYTKDADGTHRNGRSVIHTGSRLAATTASTMSETAFDLQQKWMKLRTADMNFVLDTIVERAKDSGSGQVYQLVDSGKIGLIGHSLGGEASAQVGRERNDIGAVIDLDADLGGEYLGYRRWQIRDQRHDLPGPDPYRLFR